MKSSIWAACAATFALAPVVATAQSIDLPARKSGLWETRMVTEQPAGMPAITAQMCIDAATDREMMEFGLKMSKDACKRFDARKSGASWIIDAECSFGGIRTATKTTISGDFQSAMSVRIEGTTGAERTLMTQTATWKGPCTGDMKPGDISMGHGMKMNVRQLKRLQETLPNVQIK
jgi:hypothetical protein